jgi:hypothetical protein
MGDGNDSLGGEQSGQEDKPISEFCTFMTWLLVLRTYGTGNNDNKNPEYHTIALLWR